MESRASDEQVTINNAVFVRQDGNANDNWDTITSVSLSLTTPSGSVNCNASSFPDPSVPSNVYPCADSTYSFQISSRPGYDLYAITVTHKVSDSVTLTGTANVGCNGPIPMSCSQVGSRQATLTAA
ncbi:hypothetical protein COCC4DRAFT_129745 [Bipolaris maydis ATCC 48331]|uniref:AA1-like domain-containing protein n=2 Tax=Cochliobolus heterostrophus TaxID=5016 RepID=M2UWL0_COCH5|nr:uncharacterized protein COCC4DRAFT_129745 [Bipolaris maydis ATCC 48331]EMD92213.1 hypothetical protein COCHEDRAFT_1155203 [Bipolaris maydis C5]ENI07906.1 hypothetical protein COCC4DRAFT_129745 [Bipolaris maydis ATCC 48331]KAJ6272432.1 hypothetical protein PSV08DRAFT_370433 [Bipolaris maydis]